MIASYLLDVRIATLANHILDEPSYIKLYTVGAHSFALRGYWFIMPLFALPTQIWFVLGEEYRTIIGFLAVIPWFPLALPSLRVYSIASAYKPMINSIYFRPKVTIRYAYRQLIQCSSDASG